MTKRVMRIFLASFLLTTPALAQDPMTGDEFDTYVTGKTLTFTADGTSSFGVEQYFERRRVRWSVTPGSCIKGTWHADSGQICFDYGQDDTPACWIVFDTPDGLRIEDTDSDLVIFEVRDAQSSMICGDLFSKSSK